jgi:hypothetical protein
MLWLLAVAAGVLSTREPTHNPDPDGQWRGYNERKNLHSLDERARELNKERKDELAKVEADDEKDGQGNYVPSSFLQDHERPSLDEVEQKLQKDHESLMAAFAKYEKQDGTDDPEDPKTSLVQKVAAYKRASKVAAQAKLQAKLSSHARKQAKFAAALKRAAAPKPSFLETKAKLPGTIQDRLDALTKRIHSEWGDDEHILKTVGYKGLTGALAGSAPFPKEEGLAPSSFLEEDGTNDGSKEASRRIQDKFESLSSELHDLGDKVTERNNQFASEFKGWHLAPSSLIQTLEKVDPYEKAFTAEMEKIVAKGAHIVYPDTNKFQDLVQQLPGATQQEFRKMASMLQQKALHPSSFLETDVTAADAAATELDQRIAAQDRAMKQQFTQLHASFDSNLLGLHKLSSKYIEDEREFKEKMGNLADVPSSLIQTFAKSKHLPTIEQSVAHFKDSVAEQNRKLGRQIADFKRKEAQEPESLLQEEPAIDPDIAAIFKKANSDEDKMGADLKGYDKLKSEMAHMEDPDAKQQKRYKELFNWGKPTDEDLAPYGFKGEEAEASSLAQMEPNPDGPGSKSEQQLEQHFTDAEEKLHDAAQSFEDSAKARKDYDAQDRNDKAHGVFRDDDASSFLQGEPKVDQIMQRLKRLQASMARDAPPSPQSLLEQSHPGPTLRELQQQVSFLKRKYSPKNFAAWLARDTARDEAKIERFHGSRGSLLETGDKTSQDLSQSIVAERADGVLHGLVPYAEGVLQMEVQDTKNHAKSKLVHMGMKDLNHFAASAKKLEEHIAIDKEVKGLLSQLLQKPTSLLQTDGAKQDARLLAVDNMETDQENRQRDFSGLFEKMKNLNASLRARIAQHAHRMGETVPVSFLETDGDYETIHLKHMRMMQKTDEDVAKLNRALDPRSLTSLIQEQEPKVPSDDDLAEEMTTEENDFSEIGSEARSLGGKVDDEIREAKRDSRVDNGEPDEAPAKPKRSMVKDLSKLDAIYADLTRPDKESAESLLQEDPEDLDLPEHHSEWYDIDPHAVKQQLDKTFNGARQAVEKMRELDGLSKPESFVQQRRKDAPANDDDQDLDDKDDEPIDVPMTDDGKRPLTFQDLHGELKDIDRGLDANREHMEDLREGFRKDEQAARAWSKQHPLPKKPYGAPEPEEDAEVASLLQSPHAFAEVASLVEKPEKKVDTTQELENLNESLEGLQQEARESRADFEAKQEQRAQRWAKEREAFKHELDAKAQKEDQQPSSFIEDHHKAKQVAQHPHRIVSKLQQSEDLIRDDRKKDADREQRLQEESQDLGEKMKSEQEEAVEQLREIGNLKKDFSGDSSLAQVKSSLAQTRDEPEEKEETPEEIEQEPQLRRFFDQSQWADKDDAKYQRDHMHDDDDDAEEKADRAEARYDKMEDSETAEAGAILKEGKQRREESEQMGSRMGDMLKSLQDATDGMEADKDQLVKATEGEASSLVQEDPDAAQSDDQKHPYGYYDQEEAEEHKAFDAKDRQELEDVEAEEQKMKDDELKPQDQDDGFKKVRKGLDSDTEEDAAPKSTLEPKEEYKPKDAWDEFQDSVGASVGSRDMSPGPNAKKRLSPDETPLPADAYRGGPTSMLQTRARTHDSLAVTDYSQGGEAEFQEGMRNMVGNWKAEWANADKARPSSLLQEDNVNDFGERKAPTMAEARKEFDNVAVLEAKLAAQQERMKADTARYTSSGKLGSLVETAPDPNSELGQIMDKIDRFKHHIKADHERFEHAPSHVLVDSKASFKKVKDELVAERDKLKHQAETYRDEWTAIARPDVSSFLQTGDAPDALTDEEKAVNEHNVRLRAQSFFPHPEVELAKVKYGKDAPTITGADKYGEDPKYGTLMSELQTLKDEGHQEEVEVDANDAALDKNAPHFVDDIEKDQMKEYQEAMFGSDEAAKPEPAAQQKTGLLGDTTVEDASASSLLETPAWVEKLKAGDNLPDPLKLETDPEALDKYIAAQPMDKAVKRQHKLAKDFQALLTEEEDDTKEEGTIAKQYVEADKKKEPALWAAIPKPGDDTYLDFYDDEDDERDGGPTPEEKKAELEKEKAEASAKKIQADADATNEAAAKVLGTSFVQRKQRDPDMQEQVEDLYDQALAPEKQAAPHDKEYSTQLSSLEERIAKAQAKTAKRDQERDALDVYVPDVTQSWLQAGQAPPDVLVDGTAAKDAVQGTGFDASDLLPHQSADERTFLGGAGEFKDDDADVSVSPLGSLLEATDGAHMRIH